jgi:hypothetical protein
LPAIAVDPRSQPVEIASPANYGQASFEMTAKVVLIDSHLLEKSNLPTRAIRRRIMPTSSKLNAGDWVEVLDKEEILQTLDKNGRLEELPFMPEMLAFCGKRFQVYKRAHKTCDTVNDYKGRKMNAAVHLEGIRCDGSAHGGCEAGCLIFWKEIWLKKVTNSSQASVTPVSIALSSDRRTGCAEADVIAGVTASRFVEGGNEPAFVCQATQIPAATQPLPWWELRQYVEDYFSGNVGLGRMLCGFFYMGYNGLIGARIGLGSILRWLYDKWARVFGGYPYPRRWGQIPPGERTPDAKLNLQPGELVRVKSYLEILATLDQSNKNRGLYFDAEMVPFCGGTYRVLNRVTRIVHEKTGKIQEFKNPCIILEGGMCEARYSECRLFCPRAIYSYWREIWLERIPGNSALGKANVKTNKSN